MRHKKEIVLPEVNLAQRTASASLARNAQAGHIDRVQEALRFGANVHVERDWALRWAAGGGHTEIVKILIAAGADINAKGGDALWWSAAQGHLEVLRVLLEAGAKLSPPHNRYTLRYLIEHHKENPRLAAKMLAIAGMDITDLPDSLIKRLNLSKDEYRQAAKNHLTKKSAV